MDNTQRKYSLAAKEVLKTLTSKQRKALKKDNPFIRERNALIHDLRSKGVLPHILSEITGLRRQTIWQIVKNKGLIQGDDLSVIKDDLRQIQRATGHLGHHISQIKKRR